MNTSQANKKAVSSLPFVRADLDWREQASRSATPGKRGSRANTLASCTITLEHRPTCLRVSGDIPEGRYTKSEYRQLKQTLREQLAIEMAVALTKALRLPATRAHRH